ncbi:MAG: alginate lyase family protein [Paraprevotella sp.]|nr:alginate lyase family protein [Paraprevotella sp.]
MRKLKEKIGWLLTMFLTAFTAPQLQAQEEGLRLHLDFENVTGTSVPDAASSGIKASLKNSAKVVEMGKYHVLDLGNSSGYLDLTSQAGTLFKGLDTYTLSMYNRVDETASLTGNGYSLWTFSTSEACTASEGKYSAYRLNVQRFANSTGGYASETGFEVGTESEKGKWIHVLYKQNGAKGQLYLNGVLKGAGNAMPLNSANFTSDIPYSWIGRPAFSGDSYLAQTLVCDIRLYDRELSAAEITALAAQTDDLDYEYRYGTTGDFSTLQQEIEQAKQILGGISPTDYPQAATDQYRDVIKLAQSILKEGRASQTLIDKQIAQLQEAQKTFEQSRGFVFDEESATSGYDTDRGFKHPGGLHTQADFDRIRKQLDERNTKVTAAYNILQNAEYAQSNCATWPVVTIIRGGGVGENYINAARGATIAYQNGLRWQIDGSREHAQHAVDVLMSWARTTTGIGGDSNYALAAGLYGYEFAQAAELVRDYDGWSKEDFEEFKRWMMNVWYPSCIGFLRGRNGTWENAANIPAAGYGKQGQRPGHYWSNWDCATYWRS